jgi:hypothetical protein
MDGRGISLTLGATLRSDSFSFVYTGPTESVTGHTFAPPRGQPGLPDDPVTAYVNDLRATGAVTSLMFNCANDIELIKVN